MTQLHQDYPEYAKPRGYQVRVNLCGSIVERWVTNGGGYIMNRRTSAAVYGKEDALAIAQLERAMNAGACVEVFPVDGEQPISEE